LKLVRALRRSPSSPRWLQAPRDGETSLNDLVGAGEQLRRNFNAKHFGSLQVDHHLKLGR
jgi:hypothetical protein